MTTFRVRRGALGRSRGLLAVVALLLALVGVLTAPPRAARAIAGGSDAPSNTYPWYGVASIHLGAAVSSFCTGTHVAPGWVLTAGHCLAGLDPKSLVVGLGVNPLSDPTHGERVAVNATYVMPGLDIGLIQLASSSLFGTVPLAFSEPPADDIVLVAGWGRVNLTDPANYLQMGQFRLWTDDLNPRGTSPLLRPTTGAQECNGDSGSPLLTPRQGVYAVTGIWVASSSPDCAGTVYPKTRLFGIALDVGVLSWMNQVGAPVTNVAHVDYSADDAYAFVEDKAGVVADYARSTYASGGAPTVSKRTGVGLYTVTFPDKYGWSDGNAQVQASGYEDAWCDVVGQRFSAGTYAVDVACHQPNGQAAGAPVDSAFVVDLQRRGAATPGSQVAYGVVPLNTTTAAGSWLEPDPARSFTSAGNLNTPSVEYERTGVGSYELQLGGMHADLVAPGATGSEHVVAVGSADTCQVTRWVTPKPLTYGVACFDPLGRPADSSFAFRFLSTALPAPGRAGAYVHVAPPTTPYVPPAASWWSTNPKATVQVAPEGQPGETLVTMTGLPSLGVPLVTAEAPGYARCRVQDWRPSVSGPAGTQFHVLCVDALGKPRATPYSLSYQQ